MSWVLAAFLVLAPTQDGSPIQRIVSASNLRVRVEPDIAAQEILRLPLGAIVDQLGRSEMQQQIGDNRDYWYEVNLPDKSRGWIFGGFTLPITPQDRFSVYQRLIDARLKRPAESFAEEAALATFVDAVLPEATPDIRPRFELFRLLAISRTLERIQHYEVRDPDQRQWFRANEDQAVYSEPGGQWLLDSKLLWNLEERLRGTPLGDQTAWAAAENGLPGECEGYVPCYLEVFRLTGGRYLELYPAGDHVDEALERIDYLLREIIAASAGPRNPYEVPAADRAQFRVGVKVLRDTVSRVKSEKRLPVIEHLDRTAVLFP